MALPMQREQTDRERVAGEVRAAMGRTRTTQKALCAYLGLSQAALSRRLVGVTPFDVDELYALGRYFSIQPAALLPDVGAVTGRYQAYDQVRAALAIARLAGPNQLSFEDAPRYDMPAPPVPVRLAS